MTERDDERDARESEAIRVRRVTKRYAARRNHRTEVTALDAVDLDVAAEELVVLLGPSGCGKSTLLRSVAGVVTPDGGSIELADRAIFDAARGLDSPPEQRPLSMVFQSYALWPHMSVLKNVEYPLRSTGVGRRSARDRATSTLERMGLGDLAGAYPSQLSGGQQQRVALARALVDNRNVILFDEPLSNVDAQVRQQLRLFILKTRLEYRFAGLYVTHDQDEAMSIADRIAVMRGGKILQIGTPEEVYRRPISTWVAQFVGQADRFDGVVSTVDNDLVAVKLHAGTLLATLPPERRGRLLVGDEVDVLVRPDRWKAFAAGDEPSTAALDGECMFSLFKGGHFEARVRLRDVELTANTQHRYETNDPIGLTVDPDDVMVFARSGADGS